MALPLPPDPPPLQSSDGAAGNTAVDDENGRQPWRGDDDRPQLPATVTINGHSTRAKTSEDVDMSRDGSSLDQITSALTDSEHNDEIGPLHDNDGPSTLYASSPATFDRRQGDLGSGNRKRKRRRRASVIRHASAVDLSESSSGGAAHEDDQAYIPRPGPSLGPYRAPRAAKLERDGKRRATFSDRGTGSPSKTLIESGARASSGSEALAADRATTYPEQADRSANLQRKGKTKAQADFRLSASQDPFDPLSSVRTQSSLPKSVTASSLANYAAATERAESPSLIDRRGPPTAASYPSSESLASSSQLSSSGPSSTTYNSLQGGPQPSLQQLLQTVDLGAALRLVQTLQTQQQPQHGHPQFLPTTQSMQAVSQNAEAGPPQLSISTSVPANLQRATEIESLQRAPFSGGYTSALSPIPASATEDAAPVTPHTASSDHSPIRTGKKNRALSAAFGLGRKNSSKRKRASSSAPTFSPQGSKGPDRVPDERAAMGEFARSFEERISRVHLSLSPATLRRSQNCARYLLMRYKPVFDALEEGQKPPNLLAVSRWRERKEEQDRFNRRHPAGFVGGGLVNSAGSPRPSGLSSGSDVPQPTTQVSSYGPRRNKYPKAWELYPDDIVQFEQAKQHATPDSLGQELTSPFTFSALARQPTESSDKAKQAGYPEAIASPSRSPPLPDKAFQSYSPPSRPTNFRHDSFERSPLSQLLNSSDLEPVSSVSPNSFSRSKLGRINTNGTSTADYEAAVEARKRLASGYSSSRVASATTSRDDLHAVDESQGGLQLSTADRGASSVLTATGGHRRRGSTLSPTGSVNRSTLTRQIEKLKGKTHSMPSHYHATHDAGALRRQSVPRPTHGTLTDPSESETGGHPPGTSDGFGDLPTNSAATGRRMTSRDLSLGSRGYDSEGLRSSGEDMSPSGIGANGIGRAVRRRGGQSRRLLAAAWQGLQKTLDAYPGFDDSPNFGHPGLHPIPVHKPVRPYQNAVIEDESDDECVGLIRPPREVLDIGDEEFDKLNGALRRLRDELSHVEEVFEQVPAVVDDRLTALTRYADRTKTVFGVTADYAFPRLHASVLGEIARVKTNQFNREQPDGRDSGSESDTESSSSGLSSDEGARVRNSISRRPRRQSSFNVEPLRKVTRRPSTDLGQPRVGLVNRPRSQTTSIAFDTRSSSRARQPSLLSRIPDSSDRLDHFVLLERAIDEMAKLTRGIDDDADKVIKQQQDVDQNIASVVQSLDEVQKSIDDFHFHKLRMLEDHFFRLQQSRSRPSATIDALWTLLAGALAVILWFFWLIITVLRVFRAVVLFPVRVVKWLFLIS
ncbi:hypothetical protein OIV83_000236 [Microbotryomycetes sp. JL201]|nr:hypothetical protein OIV83_000236 [Microbotryomycetes sp. JL201]